MKFILYIFLIGFGVSLRAQDDVLTVADSMPKFPGGNSELAIFIQKNISYNSSIVPEGQSLKAYVKFIVDTEGKTLQPSIIKSSGQKELDDAALRVVSKFPLWEPALDKGKKVSVYMNLPFNFKNLGVVNKADKVVMENTKAAYYYTQGIKMSDKRLYKEAVNMFDSCLALDPNYVNAHFNKAAVHMKLNEKSLACESWNKMLTIEKDAEVEGLIKKHCN